MAGRNRRTTAERTLAPPNDYVVGMWIDLTDFDGKTLMVNTDNITHISATVETTTLVHLTSGRTLTVKEGYEHIKAIVSIPGGST
jgi:uncharacterized protein YlzI (FlbEa/FlbD family)